jgi:hypothetical protein
MAEQLLLKASRTSLGSSFRQPSTSLNATGTRAEDVGGSGLTGSGSVISGSGDGWYSGRGAQEQAATSVMTRIMPVSFPVFVSIGTH